MEYELRRLVWRLDALEKQTDEWRKQSGARLANLERGVQDLVNADKIANAVAGALERKDLETRHLSFTRWQKYLAVTVGVFTCAGSLAGIVALIINTSMG